MIYSTVNHQKLPFSDPTHPPLWWRNTWMVPYFSLTVAIGDMETASRNIITLTFGYLPLFLVRFCVFHYAQCNVRNIGFKGLLKQFKRKSRGGFKNLFYLWARLVMCLPFLPARYIIPTWVELRTVAIEYFDLVHCCSDLVYSNLCWNCSKKLAWLTYWYSNLVEFVQKR